LKLHILIPCFGYNICTYVSLAHISVNGVSDSVAESLACSSGKGAKGRIPVTVNSIQACLPSLSASCLPPDSSFSADIFALSARFQSR
jgi:hypothetical protein